MSKHKSEIRLIRAKISSLEKGLVEIENISVIRLYSKKYNLLIMSDFQATLGEIEKGSVELVCLDKIHKYEGVNGYYVLKNNKFSLLISEE